MCTHKLILSIIDTVKSILMSQAPFLTIFTIEEGDRTQSTTTISEFLGFPRISQKKIGSPKISLEEINP